MGGFQRQEEFGLKPDDITSRQAPHGLDPAVATGAAIALVAGARRHGVASENLAGELLEALPAVAAFGAEDREVDIRCHSESVFREFFRALSYLSICASNGTRERSLVQFAFCDRSERDVDHC